jgi:hypothetical protein
VAPAAGVVGCVTNAERRFAGYADLEGLGCKTVAKNTAQKKSLESFGHIFSSRPRLYWTGAGRRQRGRRSVQTSRRRPTRRHHKKMFRNTYQSGFLSILYSIGYVPCRQCSQAGRKGPRATGWVWAGRIPFMPPQLVWPCAGQPVASGPGTVPGLPPNPLMPTCGGLPSDPLPVCDMLCFVQEQASADLGQERCSFDALPLVWFCSPLCPDVSSFLPRSPAIGPQ